MWTDEEKQKLVELYPTHTDKELCDLLGKTSGQIRGMKERVGLRGKFSALTTYEKESIREYYQSHPSSIDLEFLSAKLGREKTSISRYARAIGLTNNSRKPTESALAKLRLSMSKYRESDHYKNDVLPRCIEILNYYAQNQHPAGMRGKTHTESTRARMSEKHKAIWMNMSDSERSDLLKKIKSGILNHSHYRCTSNAYSRCNGGYREDIGCYFRSSWEANIARLFNYLGIIWEYEPTRYSFPDVGDGVLSYCPDFFLTDTQSIVEVKGWMDEKSLARLKKLKQYYPQVYEKLLLVDEKRYRTIEKDFSKVISNWE